MHEYDVACFRGVTGMCSGDAVKIIMDKSTYRLWSRLIWERLDSKDIQCDGQQSYCCQIFSTTFGYPAREWFQPQMRPFN
jgi:hypothetical protein